MDYYVKKAVQGVKERRRSKEEEEQDNSIEESTTSPVSLPLQPANAVGADLHVAARNSVINIDPTNEEQSSIIEDFDERYRPAVG